MTGPFRATHRVASTGVQAWARPDPNEGAIAALDPNLEVQVVERYGDWAQVVCSNGWGAWVDGRCLYSLQAAQAPVARPAATTTVAASPISRRAAVLLGACGVGLLGALLPWLSVQGAPDDSNAFDIPAKFLFDYKTATNGGLKIGVLVLLVAAGAAVALLVKGASPVIRRVCGGVLAAMPVLFILQVNRLESAAGGGGGLDPGIGAFLTILAGVALAVVPDAAP